MYTLIRSNTVKSLLTQQAPALLLAFVIAEMFYKFHSFTLECGAFLLTWLVTDFIFVKAFALFEKKQTVSS